MDASGLEAGAVGELAQDEERAGSGQRAAAGVQEELGPVAAIEVRAAEREVATHGFSRGPTEWDEPLLRALPDHPDDALLQRDAVLLEADGLRHAQPGAVQQLDERTVAKRPRRRPCRCVDETFRLGRGQGTR